MKDMRDYRREATTDLLVLLAFVPFMVTALMLLHGPLRISIIAVLVAVSFTCLDYKNGRMGRPAVPRLATRCVISNSTLVAVLAGLFFLGIDMGGGL